eukprot:1156850-Pelagomonas_calceolata.AAC.5
MLRVLRAHFYAKGTNRTKGVKRAFWGGGGGPRGPRVPREHCYAEVARGCQGGFAIIFFCGKALRVERRQLGHPNYMSPYVNHTFHHHLHSEPSTAPNWLFLVIWSPCDKGMSLQEDGVMRPSDVTIVYGGYKNMIMGVKMVPVWSCGLFDGDLRPGKRSGSALMVSHMEWCPGTVRFLYMLKSRCCRLDKLTGRSGVRQQRQRQEQQGSNEPLRPPTAIPASRAPSLAPIASCREH